MNLWSQSTSPVWPTTPSGLENTAALSPSRGPIRRGRPGMLPCTNICRDGAAGLPRTPLRGAESLSVLGVFAVEETAMTLDRAGSAARLAERLRLSAGRPFPFLFIGKAGPSRTFQTMVACACQVSPSPIAEVRPLPPAPTTAPRLTTDTLPPATPALSGRGLGKYNHLLYEEPFAEHRQRVGVMVHQRMRVPRGLSEHPAVSPVRSRTRLPSKTRPRGG